MEHLIATYLFRNKSCPLPAVGKLRLTVSSATVAHGAKLIEPPVHQITLVHGYFSTSDFIKYISKVEDISADEAHSRLHAFCDSLQNLDSFAEAKVLDVGKFYVNAEGNLVFKNSSYPDTFQGSISAEKVIRADSSHNLLVGDTESSTALMTEYFNVDEPVPRQRWWIAALLLTLIGLAVISLYYGNETNAGLFGNATKSPLREAPKTYTTPK